MNWKKATVIFIVLTVVAIAAWDILAIENGGKEASISWTLIQWSYEYPSIVFALGFTCGHLFWRMKTPGLTTKEGGSNENTNQG